MDTESLKKLIQETRENINAFEDMIFREKRNEYSIYRAETSIFLDNLKFIEKIADYSLNAEEIEQITKELQEMNDIIEKDYNITTNKEEIISTSKVESNVNDFNSINFDAIAEEVNNTSDNYPSIQEFIAN